MLRCDFASCTERAGFFADGWDFCGEHLREHRDLKRHGDLRHAHALLADRRDLGRVPNAALTREELLHALEQEVGLPVPPPRLVTAWTEAVA